MFKHYASPDSSRGDERIPYVPSCYHFSRLTNILYSMPLALNAMVNFGMVFTIGLVTYILTRSSDLSAIITLSYCAITMSIFIMDCLRSVVLNKHEYRDYIYPIEVQYNEMPGWRQAEYKKFLLRSYKIVHQNEFDGKNLELKAISRLFQQNKKLSEEQESLRSEIENEIIITRESREAME